MTQRVFITAGAGGIGRVIADSYAAHGAKVYVCDQDADAVARMPADITATRVDVTDEAALDGWIQAGLKQLGGCDVLINNAGIAGQAGPVEELDLLERFRAQGADSAGLVDDVERRPQRREGKDRRIGQLP